MTSVKHFIEDLEFLGPCRFVVVGNGAILEAIGEFTELRQNDNGLATVSNDDNSFECHIRMGEVKKAAFVKKEKPDGKTMHITRLMDADGKSLLSAILAGEDGGEVDPGAIKFWENLRDRFGDEFALTEEE